MKALIVGIGSMGKRRAALLKKLGVTAIGVDANPDRLNIEGTAFERAYSSVDEAMVEKPDMAFICTSPLSHQAVAEKLLSLGLHVFSELNLVNNGYDKLKALAEEKGVIVFPSSTWLYRLEMQYMTEAVQKNGRPCAYTYHIGQYLPDWHPWESYKSYFVGSKQTNGCREILALELPWLLRAFGPVVDIHAFHRNLTNLEVDYPDTYQIVLQHENGSIGTLTVDITAPVPVRDFEAVSEHFQLFWNGTPDTLFAYNKETGKKEQIDLYHSGVERRANYASFIVENAYSDEIAAFLDAVSGKKKQIYTLDDDAQILRHIDRIEENV